VLNRSNSRFFGGLFDTAIKIYSEAHAVHAYLCEYRDVDSRPNDALGAVIVDIGGGTTDICVVKDGSTETISFGLAGDRLIRRSIVYSTTKDTWDDQREFKPGSIELKRLLTEPERGDENLDRYLYAYENIVKLQGSKERTQERIYYKDLAELVDIVMQRYPPRYESVTDKATLVAYNTAETNAANALTCLADTIKLRYILLFYLLGTYLKQKADSLNLSQWHEVRIYLAGFGSRGLGFCCGNDIVSEDTDSSVSRLAFFKVLERVVQKASGITIPVLFIPPTESDKYEVVKGLQASTTNLPEMKTPLPNEVPVVTLTKQERKDVKQKAEPIIEQIKKDIDDVLDSIISDGQTNVMLSHLKTFCDLFKGLLDRSVSWASISAIWTKENQIESAVEAACEARFTMDMMPVGLAVSYFNLLIDAASRKWRLEDM